MEETPETRDFINKIWCINTEDGDWDGIRPFNIEVYSTDSAFSYTTKGSRAPPRAT